jgi:broad specificity phosphatase PhoE
MDSETVTRHAEAHARAMVDGDLKRAGSDLTESGRAGAAAVMGAMPKRIDSAEVTSVATEADEKTAVIVYSGEGKEVSVLSRWAEHDGRPMITELKLL